MEIWSWSDSWISHLCLPVSKTFVRSTKATKSGCRCCLHFSCSCRRENTISVADLLARETHCNSWYSLRQNLEPLQCYSGEKLLNNGKKGDATVVIAVTSIAFVLVHCDEVCIPHVLWYFTLSSAETGFHTASVLRQGFCLFQVPFQRQGSREPCLTLQGLNHCQSPSTQKGSGLLPLFHSHWIMTLS